MNENKNLNDIMEGGTLPRRSSTTVVDLTGKKPVINSSGAVNDQANKRQAVPINAGPLNMQNIKPVDIDSILPRREPTPNPMEESMMADLDAAIDRECESISERHRQLFDAQDAEMEAKEAEREAAIQDAEDDFALNGVTRSVDDDDTYGLYDNSTIAQPEYTSRFNIGIGDDIDNTTATNTSENEYYSGSVRVSDGNMNDSDYNNDMDTVEKSSFNVAPPVNILDNINNDDLFDDEDEDESATNTNEPSAQEVLDELKVQIKEHITPIRKSLDLSKFTIAKKAISAQKVMKLAVHSHQNVADWVLPSAGRSISMTGLSGPEILKLNPENSNRNRQNTFRDMYHVIYDHVFDGNKPDYETWLKQTRFVDLQHIYFALYMATFGGSNFINYSCPKCNKVFIKTIDFKDMIVYADDETKTKVQNMLKMDSTSKSNDSYDVELVQVSNSYAFALHTPSIWNVIMETASLSDQFLEKHADLIDMVAYIDGAYIIDTENNQLIPVDTKPDPNDMAKTSARRIKAMYDIISTLSSEEYYSLRAAINEFDEDATKLSYKIPGCTCPACNAEIPANTEMTPDSMLFTRHQLAAIGNM